jgi:NADH dehydrogenase
MKENVVEQKRGNSHNRIVILGAGVAGLRIAKKLQNSLDNRWDIILIDENDYHQYLYKIHEVCNVDYDEKDIVVPLEKLLDPKRVSFKKTSVISIDSERNVVLTSSSEEPYDIVVISLGSHPAYYNIQGIEANGFTLANFEQAKKIREKIKELFTSVEDNKIPPKILIGGAGFSGVELAGEFTDWLPVLYERHGLSKPEKIVTVVEAFSSILPGWDKSLCSKGQDVLEKRGVNFVFDDPITSVETHSIKLRSGQSLEYDIFIWTGGVRGDPACGQDFETMRQKIVIDEYCRAAGYENVFVAGDSACTMDSSGNVQPPTAHIAMEQADTVCHNILSSIKGTKFEEYEFKRAGEIVTLGRTEAVGELFGMKFTGFTAKLLKKVVHWWYLYQIGGLKLILD